MSTSKVDSISAHAEIAFRAAMETHREAVLEGPSVRLRVEVRNKMLGQPDENHGDTMAQLSLSMNKDGDAVLVTIEQSRSQNLFTDAVARVRRLEWTNTIDGAAIPDANLVTEIALDLLPRLEDVHAGHSVAFEPSLSSYVGNLTPEARDAVRDITDYLEDARWTTKASVWPAEEWLEGSDWPGLAEDAGVDPADDAAMAAVAAHCIASAESDDISLYDLDGVLTGLRNEWQAEQT
jgi:hypothetical protein